MIDASLYKARRARVAAWLTERGIAAARFEDFENMRGSALRYLCGQPSDAFLIITADARSILVAWDVNMASRLAHVDTVLAYTDYGRKDTRATAAVLEMVGIRPGSKIALSSSISYLRYIDFTASLENYDLLCEEQGVDEVVRSMRSVKDASEVATFREAARITDQVMDSVEDGLRAGRLSTEIDVALTIEREARVAGCEGLGFETIAAGPSRSFGIHAVPPCGAGPFGTEGMSILDFGLVLDGLTTDVTMSFIKTAPDSTLSARQDVMIALVEKAHSLAIGLCRPGFPARDVALAVQELFAAEGFFMPHALGHGVGLDAHEAPGINTREENGAILEPGQVITIEPGLYDPDLGGVRLEDTVLITESGCEKLTHSRIVRL